MQYTPAQLKATAEALVGGEPGPIPDIDAIDVALGPINALAPDAARWPSAKAFASPPTAF